MTSGSLSLTNHLLDLKRRNRPRHISLKILLGEFRETEDTDVLKILLGLRETEDTDVGFLWENLGK